MTRLESDYYDFMAYDPAHSKAGLSHYVPLFPRGPVLELACGRGEFLELLREAGVDGEGIDLDEGMVQAARASGLTVQLTDALSGLRSRGDDSVHGVFSAHFVEHLQPDELEAVVAEAARVLAPGGVFVAATPNAACLSVAGYDFWKDPTHVRFYDPRLLAFYCAKAGLEVVETGENPRNRGGAPPGTTSPPAHVDPDLRADVVEAMQQLAWDRRKNPDSPWHVVGHLIGVLEERLRTTQQELSDLHRAYTHLLDRLYPSNEVYVVARAR